MKKIWFSNWRCFWWNSKPASYLINLHFQKQSFILKTYKNRAMFLKMQKFASGNNLRIPTNCFMNSCNSFLKNSCKSEIVSVSHQCNIKFLCLFIFLSLFTRMMRLKKLSILWSVSIKKLSRLWICVVVEFRLCLHCDVYSCTAFVSFPPAFDFLSRIALRCKIYEFLPCKAIKL